MGSRADFARRRAQRSYEQMHGTIVCGVTDTPEAGSAAQLSAALASRLELRLVLVHVLTGPRGLRGGPETTFERAEQRIEEIARGLCDRAETRVVRGSRVDELARVAADEGADLIVLGSRARGARGRQLRCALACELEAAQSVPVLIAPPATRRRSERRLALAEPALGR